MGIFLNEEAEKMNRHISLLIATIVTKIVFFFPVFFIVEKCEGCYFYIFAMELKIYSKKKNHSTKYQDTMCRIVN